jgi:tape measure domain-containing protein
MSDSYNIKIGVDASGGQRGVKQFSSAISDAMRILKAFDQQSKSAFETLSKLGSANMSGLSKTVRGTAQAIETLNRVKLSKSLVNNLQMLQRTLANFRFNADALKKVPEAMTALSKAKIDTRFVGLLNEVKAALKGFRGPPAGVDKWRAVLSSLAKISIAASLPARVTSLSAAMKGFKGPSASALKFPTFIKQLAGLRITPALAQNLNALRLASAGFQGPSASAVKNLTALLHAMSTATPGQINAVAAALTRLHGLNLNVGRSMGNAGRAGQSAMAGWTRGIGGTIAASRILDRQMSLTYHAAGLLTTALGTVSVGAVAQGIYQTGSAFIALQRTLSTVATSTTEVEDHLKFLNDLATRMPIDIQAAAESYGKFAVAARLTGVSAADTQKVFAGFSTAFAAMGVGAENQKYALLALEQMFTKGKISAEELQQQLGEHLPGAIKLLSDTVGKGTTEFFKMMKAGEITPDYLIKMADGVTQRFGPALEAALNSSQGKIQDMQNAWTEFKKTIFDNGFNAGLGALAAQFAAVLRSDDMLKFAKSFGASLGEAMKVLGVLGRMLVEHKDQVKDFLIAFAATGTLVSFAAAVRSAISPTTLLFAGMLGLVKLLQSDSSITTKLLGIGAAVAGLAIYMGAGAVATAKFTGALLGWTAAAYGAAKGGAWLGKWIGENLGDKMIQYMPGFSKALADFSKTDLVTGLNGVFGIGDDVAGQAGEQTGSTYMKSIGDALDPTKIFGSFSDEFNKLKAQADAVANGIQGQELSNEKQINKQREEELKLLEQKAKTLTPAAQKLWDEVNAIGKANDLYKSQLTYIDEIQKKRGLSDAQAASMKKVLDAKTLDDRSPVGAMVRDYRVELNAAKARTGYEKAVNDAVAARNDLLKQGIDLTDEQAKALTDYQVGLAKMNGEIGNGIERWSAKVGDFNDNMQNAIADGIGGLSDEITNFVTGADADFAGLARSILASFVKISLDSVLKDMFGAIGMDGQKNGASQADQALAKLANIGENITTAMTNVYTSGLAIDGLGLGATGSDAKSIEEAATKGISNAVTRAPLADIPGSKVLPNGPLSTDRLPLEKALGDNTSAIQTMAKAQVDASKATTSAANVINPARPGSMLDQLRKGETTSAQISAARPGSMLDQLRKGEITPDKVTIKTANAADLGLRGGLPLPTSQAMAKAVPAFAGGGGGGLLGNAAGSGSYKEVGNFVSRGADNVDARLRDILSTAAKRSGLNVEAYSGQRYAGHGEHTRGLATDVKLTDPLTGKSYGSAPGGGMYQNAEQFRVNEQFAQTARQVQMEKYPELSKDFRWGGYFGGKWGKNPATGKDYKYGAGDGMHYDLGGDGLPNNKMGGGSWAGGLSDQQRALLGRQGYNPTSVGMGSSANSIGKPQLDPTTTNSIDALNAKMTSMGQAAQTAGAPLEQMKTKLSETGTNAQTGAQTVGMANQQKTMADQQMAMSAQTTGIQVQTAGMNAQMAGPQFQTAGQSIAQAGQSAASAGQTAQSAGSGLGDFGSGISGLLGPLSSAIPGLGQFGGMIMQLASSLLSGGGGGGGGLGGLLGGLFSEGGYSDSPVSRARVGAGSFANAPHFREGTTNTSGGMPAILHDNEAVIPLSRGRKIPVDMPQEKTPMYGSGAGGSRARGAMVFNFNGVKDADSFRRSKSQIANDLGSKVRRAQMRDS